MEDRLGPGKRGLQRCPVFYMPVGIGSFPLMLQTYSTSYLLVICAYTDCFMGNSLVDQSGVVVDEMELRNVERNLYLYGGTFLA